MSYAEQAIEELEVEDLGDEEDCPKCDASEPVVEAMDTADDLQY